MIDQHLFKLAGAGSILKKLAVLEVLQAFLIIGQALSLSAVLTTLWQGKKLNWQYLLIFIVCLTGRQLIDLLKDKMLETYSSQE
ncbi:MAG: thiol reductant ABC exporter subunit CydD, partial [Lactobacillus iners]|nr:thiol reductant ABC exporter subunit CydD [Lactobacillus iners]